KAQVLLAGCPRLPSCSGSKAGEKHGHENKDRRDHVYYRLPISRLRNAPLLTQFSVFSVPWIAAYDAICLVVRRDFGSEMRCNTFVGVATNCGRLIESNYTV